MDKFSSKLEDAHPFNLKVVGKIVKPKLVHFKKPPKPPKEQGKPQGYGYPPQQGYGGQMPPHPLHTRRLGLLGRRFVRRGRGAAVLVP